MSLINRLNRIIRANVSDLRASGPPESISQILGEMDSSLRDARRQVVVLRRQERQVIDEIRGHRDQADKWEDRAIMALKQQEEGLAREALMARNVAMDRAAALREELDELRAQAQDLDSAIQALEVKLEGTRSRAGDLRDARPRASAEERRAGNESAWDAEFRRRVGRYQDPAPAAPPADSGESSAFDSSRILNEIDRMGSRIDAFEADVEAARELSEDDPLYDPARSRLDARFRELEQQRDLRNLRKSTEHDDLADLKKKFEK